MRYDYNRPWTERVNALSNFNFDAPSPLQIPGLKLVGGLQYPGQSGLPRGQWNSDFRDWQPRASFAYQLNPSTVIRSGFELFAGPFAQGYNGNAVPNTGFTASTTWASSVNGATPTNYWDNPFPNGFVVADKGAAGLLDNIGQTAIGMKALPETSPKPWSRATEPVTVLGRVFYSGRRLKKKQRFRIIDDILATASLQ